MSNIDDLPPPPGAQTSSIDDLPPPPKADAPAENPHDFVPFAKQAWQGVKDAADEVSSKPLPTLAYDHLVKPAVDTYKAARDSGENVVNAGLDAAAKGTGDLASAGTSLVAPETTPVQAYIKSLAAGNSQADALKDARNVGALIAAPAGVGKMLGKAAPAVSDFAENRAASALGWTKALRKKYGNDAAMTAGRVGLDNGVVTPLASTADKLEGMQGIKDAAGQTIGGTMDKLDQAGIKEFNPKDAADRVGSEIGDAYANEPLFQGLKGQYDNLLQTINQRGNQPISFADAQKLKQVLGEYGYNSGIAVPGREQAQQATGIVNKALDEAVDRGAAQTGDTDLLANLQSARKEYGAAKNTLSALDNKEAGEQGNKSLGLSDTVALSSPNGAAKLAAKKLGEKYGQNIAAVGADKVAKILQNSPETLGKYAGVLAAAQAKSPDSFKVTHRLLMKSDPAYANLVNKD